MNEIEITAKTLEEATQKALEQLGVDEDMVDVVVLKKGRPGVLGVGAEEAKIKVTLLNQPHNINNVILEAKNILEKIIESMGIVAEIHIIQSSDGDSPVTLNIEGEDLGVLIGRRGQALASLQYIVRLIVAEKCKTWAPLNIDIADYKKRRYESLRNLASRLADQVITSKRSVSLEPMPADERRIVHLSLADHPDVATQSIGVGEKRKVIVSSKKH